MPLKSVEMLYRTGTVDHQAEVQRKVAEKFMPELENLSPAERIFAVRSVEKILALADRFRSKVGLFPDQEDVEDGVWRWLRDKVHGVKHSFAVYERIIEIRDEEVEHGNTVYAVDDEELEIRSLLHDLGEFMPVYDKNHQRIHDKDWQLRRHAQIISLLILRIGKELEVEDAYQLALDLRHHDFYWSRPTPEASAAMKAMLSPAGQLLADADRVVGNNVKEAISRNRGFSLGKGYFLRDLSAAERAQWKVRTGSIFDGMSAILTEFSGQDHWFYTDTGKKLNRAKQEQFRDELVAYYQEQYRNGWALLNVALEEHQPIEIGIKGEKDGDPFAVTKTPEQAFVIQHGMTDEQIRAVMSQMIETPFPHQPHPRFPDREYFGYSIKINGKEWIDPSILRFSDKQSLEDAIDEAIAEYQGFFAADQNQLE